MELTERLDLRGGRPCWDDVDDPGIAADPCPTRVEVAIVGAGIMGAMLAERLARQGHQVALLDRRPPSRGSTSASTALVMWAADVPLTMLAEMYGKTAAIRRWRRVHRAIRDLDGRARVLNGKVRWRPKKELYLAGTLLDADGLRREADLRREAGLPSAFLAPDMVRQRYALPARAALLSSDTFEVDPVALTLALLARARASGATLIFPSEVASIAQQGADVVLMAPDGRRLIAQKVILATGYEAARWFLPEAFTLGASYAIATHPGTAPAWTEEVMLWEASSTYLYARGTRDARLILGGGDEELVDSVRRDAILKEKRARLELDGANLLGADDLDADCAWSATFGSSPDGLPAIGKARNSEHIWLASGFGGNGITFAALAADLIGAEFAGTPDPDAPLFSPYRDFDGD